MIKNFVLKLKSLYRFYYLPVIIFLLACTYFYYRQIGSFSFVDEYNNFVGGYFLLKGRALFSQIFFNKQMLTPYLSAVISAILQPDSLYKLILYHRLFIILFSLAFNLLLLKRFGVKIILFIISYEALKYYAFGNMFQAESLIAYPLAFLFCLVWQKINHQPLSNFDYTFSAILTWFVVFNREIFAPVAIICFIIIAFKKTAPVIIFLILSTLIVASVSIPDYFYQLVVSNKETLVNREISDNGSPLLLLLKSFGYPFYLIFTGENNVFRTALVVLDLVFLFCSGYFLIIKKQYFKIILIWIVLGLAALRPQLPGQQFYGAYRMLPWLAIFAMAISILTNNKAKIIVIFLLLLITFSPEYFIWQRKNVTALQEFTTNYTRYYITGDIIKKLSLPTDKLFVDGYDSLVFWSSTLDSSYKYALYYPNQEPLKVFGEERIKMFKTNPPEFYVKECSTTSNYSLPDFIKDSYVPLKFQNDQTCIYVRKDKINSIPKEKWEEISIFGYHYN